MFAHREGAAMIDLLEQQRDRLRELCRRHGVARLEVFGSATGERFDPLRSDLDFLVEFQRAPGMDSFAQYFGLKEDLEALFARPVDLVMSGALRNPFFIQGVNESRVLLYAA
jgi:uncharacterized protein